MKRRLSGAIWGSVLGTALAALLSVVVNPWFMDGALSYLATVVVPLSAVGWMLGTRIQPLEWPWLWGVASVVLFVVAVFRPHPPPVGTQLLIVGIDGASWPVIERTETPNLDALAQAGMKGTLMAEEPLFSPLLWSTMATGRRPDEHGIRGIRTRTGQAQGARFWDVARHAKRTVGLYKWLVTWPPPDDNVPGFTVPAWLAGDAQTHPAELSWVKEIELSRRTKRKKIAPTRPMVVLIGEALLGGLRWSTLMEGIKVLTIGTVGIDSPGETERRLRHLRLRIDRDAFVYQLHKHKPDLASFSVYVTDAISHTHWTAGGGRYVNEAYELADQVLGDLVAAMGPDAHILVISDHGFRDAGKGDTTHSAVPKTDTLQAWLNAKIGAVQIVRVGRQLVISPDAPVPEDTMRQTIALLTHQDGSAVYSLDALPHSSDWSLKFNTLPREEEWSEREVSGIPLTDLVRPGRPESGEHDPKGIVILHGPKTADRPLGQVQQVDVAPTILALLGLPVADNMVGSAWVDEQVERVPSHDHLAPKQSALPGATNEARLKSLGYID